MPAKGPVQAAAGYSFEELDRDLVQLLDTMQTLKVEKKKIGQMLAPFASTTSRSWSNFGRWTVAVAFLIIGFCYFRWDATSWHLAAFGRIALIQILPYYDWVHLKDEVCLVSRLASPSTTAERFDCNLCESLDSFDDLPLKIDPRWDERRLQEAVRRRLDVERPLVIPEGQLDHWPVGQTPSALVRELRRHRSFADSTPCHLNSNVYNSMKGAAVTVDSFFNKLESFDESFTVHFQNCEPEAVRVFRNYTYRPVALPDEIGPVTFNWLLWNRNYETQRYKRIDLVEKYAAIGQISGGTRLRLLPRMNCQSECRTLDGVLYAGQLLILTGLWDVEYALDGGTGGGENFAAILEIRG